VDINKQLLLVPLTKYLTKAACNMKYSAVYTPGSIFDHPLEFALYGLARQAEWPKWVCMDVTKPILELGPSTKLTIGAERLNWPEYNFDPNCFGNDHPDTIYKGTLPHDTGSVGWVVATHVLEHLADPLPIILEVERVLAKDCPFNIVVPHADSNVFKQDLDHKKAFILDTWDNLIGSMYGKRLQHMRIGVNFKFAIKEGNEMVVTQLVKM